MAIPNRTTITCPNCGTHEDVVIADTSVGPAGRVSNVPVFVLLDRPLWAQSRRDGDTFLSCNTCGEAEFISLAQQIQRKRTVRRADKL